MADLSAVYLDLCDLQSARVWRWLHALGIVEDVDVRPFSIEVADPWECTAPPFSLELLMLLEQAREHDTASVVALVDAAFERISPVVESAHAELAIWLQVGAAAGLPLAEYDAEMERYLAEVGLWQAEAREDHGVLRPPTLLFDDGVTIYLQLDQEVDTPEEARRFLDVVLARVAAVGSRSAGG